MLPSNSMQRLPLLHGSISREEAEDEDDDMLVRLEYPNRRDEFFSYLLRHTEAIGAIVKHHLNLRPDQRCSVAGMSEWICGGFNVCIPISIANWRAQRILLRCPLPYKLGGSGNVDEKLRCEAATYSWISENCPEVPIPYLWGVGLPDGASFTPLERLPFFPWMIEKIRRAWARIFRGSSYSRLACRPAPHSLSSGYLLMDFVEKDQGSLLALSWASQIHNGSLTKNLFRSLSRITLSLGRHSFDRIGSPTIDNLGRISLTNRPLTLRLPVLENDGIPTNIPPHRTYSTAQSYFFDLLGCHDLRLQHQPNSIRDKYDAEAQMAVLTAMRSILPHFFDSRFQYGPFTLQLTDLRPHNIFVDKDCNITSVVDLEWACALPAVVHHPPFWLSGHQLDELEGDAVKDFDKMSAEFVDIFEEEERKMLGSNTISTPTSRASIMRTALARNTHWCMAALNEPRGMYNIFLEHIQPMYAPSHQSEVELAIKFQQILAPYWKVSHDEFITRKLQEREQYLKELRLKFEKT